MIPLDKFGVPYGSNRSVMAQPKPRNRFRIQLFGFNDQDGGEGTKPIILNTNSVSLPKVSYTEQKMHRYNTESSYVTRKSWQPVDLILRDEIQNGVLSAVTGHAYKIHNYFRRIIRGNTQSVDYKFEMWIQIMDGSSADDTAYGGTINTWVLEGCTITDIDYGDLDYAESGFNEISLTIKPDNCYCVDHDGNLVGGK
ncbi:hypothetical protein NVP2275O_382 [Vibrio phage 2.275.O._10N.286.54.E11]|nr:hypothetical protein NVP2275O_382 [Vibrio phage 2.275.O._10N.286.54.E11]